MTYTGIILWKFIIKKKYLEKLRFIFLLLFVLNYFNKC